MRTVDIGIDAARALRLPGPGRVHAVFARALYLRVPGGLLALVTSQAPRGPLHLRVGSLPTVEPGCAVRVDADSIRIGDHAFRFDVPTWSPRLPPAESLPRAREAARCWLPDLGPALDLGCSGLSELPAGALAALRGGDLPSFAEAVGGRGPGLTPAGDDLLAGVLLAVRVMRSVSSLRPETLRQCAHRVRTNDIARAFLVCAAEGRCIEPVHDLLTGLARADRRAVSSAAEDLRRFGSTSGRALMYGVRTALLELPART